MSKCGRNDPCICGSGKKFKKCCEQKRLQNRMGLFSGSSHKSTPLFQRVVQKVEKKEEKSCEEN